MLGLLLLCISLGFWQLDRAEQKQNLAAAGDEQTTLAEVLLAPAEHLWQQTVISGRFLAELPALLDNQTHNGVQGFQVFSRFQLDSGQQLLVNRGWVSQQHALDIPNTSQQRFEGIVAPYRKAGMRMGPAVVSPPETRPVVVNYPTQQEWEALFQQSLLPITLWLAADQPHGFVRDWQLQSVPPEKHLGYAFQWFAMATAVAVIGLILLIRILRQPKGA